MRSRDSESYRGRALRAIIEPGGDGPGYTATCVTVAALSYYGNLMRAQRTRSVVYLGFPRAFAVAKEAGMCLTPKEFRI